MKKPNRSRTNHAIQQRKRILTSTQRLDANLRRLSELLPSAASAAAGLRALGEAFARIKLDFPSRLQSKNKL